MAKSIYKGTIKNRMTHQRVLTCDFDELSENNLLNQILKTTVILLLKNGNVTATYKNDLKKKMLFFPMLDMLEPTNIKWTAIQFQRNNQTYRMLIGICQLVMEGMLLTTDSGDYHLSSFWMSRECVVCMRSFCSNIIPTIFHHYL